MCGFYEGGGFTSPVKSDRVNIVELLLERGADVNLGPIIRKSHKTPLHQALGAPYNARSEIVTQQAAIVQLLLSHGAAVDSISGSIYRENQYGEAPIDAWEHSVAPGSALYHMRQTRDLHKLRTRLDSLEKLLTKVFDVVSDDCTRRRRRDRGRAHRHSRSRSRSRSECRRGR